MRKPRVTVRFDGITQRLSSPIRVKKGINTLDVSTHLATELKRRNPVDTGRSRRGWRIKIKANGDNIVRNRVHYVQYLERGHSKQAPDGFVEQAKIRTRRWLRQQPTAR